MGSSSSTLKRIVSKHSRRFLGVSELGFTFSSPSRYAGWEPGADAVFYSLPLEQGWVEKLSLAFKLISYEHCFVKAGTPAKSFPEPSGGGLTLPGLTLVHFSEGWREQAH